MIHMGSDHRCVMATFTITMPGKNNHYKNTRGKHDMIKHQERDQAEETLKLGSLSSKKDTKRSSKKKKKKDRRNKKSRSASRK